MNWQMLLYFLRRVVPHGHQETEELLKIVSWVEQRMEMEKAAKLSA
jgi:hypothetical protein